MHLLDYYLALITGATSPIGQALALHLSKKGIPLLLTGRDETILRKLQTTLPNTEILPLDLNVETKPLIEWIRKKKPNLIINNAGAGLYGEALSHPIAENLALFDLNARIPLEITLASIEMLEDQDRYGTILNVASAAGTTPFPYFSVYSSAKSALINASLALDVEYAPKGIRVLAACPGMVKTNFQKRASKGAYTKAPSSAMSPLTAAHYIIHQIEKDLPYFVFGPLTRWSLRLLRLFPLGVRLRLAGRAIRKRAPR